MSDFQTLVTNLHSRGADSTTPRQYKRNRVCNVRTPYPLARTAAQVSRDGFICFSDFHGIKKTSIALQQG